MLAVSPLAAGFLTVFPCETRPGTSTLNYLAGEAVDRVPVHLEVAEHQPVPLTQAEVSLQAEVARTYTEVRTTQLRLDFARKNVESQRETSGRATPVSSRKPPSARPSSGSKAP